MSLKYRIVYDTYPRYEKGSFSIRYIHYFFIFLMCVACILLLIYLPHTSNLYKLILPGDPAVTTEAFRQFSEAMDGGETIANALEVFCDAVMEFR